MNQALHRIAAEIDLADEAYERARLQFGLACVGRVQHFIESSEVLDCIAGLQGFLDGRCDREHLAALADAAGRLANQHRGSPSLDGCGHAAVSATYAVANALAGRALAAADYAAYARVYGEGGYGAVAEVTSFEPEHEWQVGALLRLAGR